MQSTVHNFHPSGYMPENFYGQQMMDNCFGVVDMNGGMGGCERFSYHGQGMSGTPRGWGRADDVLLQRCRRRPDLTQRLGGGGGFKGQGSTVARRNERERNRVRHINTTFSTLRQHLPMGAKAKKMSKVETLRSAIRYINHLRQILRAQEQEEGDLDEEDRGRENAPPGSLSSETSGSPPGSPRSSSLASPASASARPTSPVPSTASEGSTDTCHHNLAPEDEDDIMDLVEWFH